MATERLAPDVLLVQTQLTGAVTDIDDDPDSPDGLWLTASGNNVNTELHASFPAPSGNLTVGSNLQQLKVWVRQFDEGQTGTPQVRVELWEAGSLVRADIATNVNDGGTLRFFNWNASELADVSGVDVEIKVFGIKTGGSPGTRNTVEIGAVEWNVDYTTGTTVTGTLYVDPDTFPTPTVKLTTTGSPLVDGDTFPEATITTSVTVVGTLFSDGDTFPAATVALAVPATAYADPDTFPEATVTSGTTVAGTLYVDPDSFPVATVGIAATGTPLVDADSFGATTVKLAVPGALYADGDTFPEATIVTGTTVIGTLYTDSDAFPVPTVSLAVPAAAYVDPDVFPAATVVTGTTVEGTLYTDADTFPTATVKVAVPASALVDGDTFPTASITLAILPTLFVDGDTFPAATVVTGTTVAGTLYVDPDSFAAALVKLAVSAALFVDPDTFPEATVLTGAPITVVGDLFESVNMFALATTKLSASGTLHVEPDAFGTALIGVAVTASVYVDPDTFYAAQVVAGTLARHRFSVLGDTANDAVNSGDLAAEYASSSIAAALQFIDVAGDVLDIWTVGALSPTEQTTLVTLVGNHQGADVDSHDAHVTIVIVLASVTITEDTTWQDLGAAVLIPSEFGQVANMRIHARLEAKCDDGPSAELAQLRLVDDDGSVVTQLQTTPQDIADSATWLRLAFEGDTAPVDDVLPHRLRLEGRLNGSTSASVQRSNISLVEMR